MPRGVKAGSKRDRQYEHIKDSYIDRKERREAGETKNAKKRDKDD